MNLQKIGKTTLLLLTLTILVSVLFLCPNEEDTTFFIFNKGLSILLTLLFTIFVIVIEFGTLAETFNNSTATTILSVLIVIILSIGFILVNTSKKSSKKTPNAQKVKIKKRNNKDSLLLLDDEI